MGTHSRGRGGYTGGQGATCDVGPQGLDRRAALDLQALERGPNLLLRLLLNAYNIVFAAFLVAAGRIADLLGRRKNDFSSAS